MMMRYATFWTVTMGYVVGDLTLAADFEISLVEALDRAMHTILFAGLVSVVDLWCGLDD